MSNTSDENAGCASPSGSEVELINSSSNARESSDFKTDSPTTGVVKDTGSDVGTALSEDDLLVIDMGYKPTLHRGLNSFMNFAYGFTEVSVLCSIAITYSLGLSNGGNVVILWAFVVQFFCVMFIAHSMAEICSAFPSAGSVYHWSAQLASKEHGPLWSYITGWWNFIGNGLGDAAFAYGFANFLNAGLVASSATPITAQQQVGVSIAVLWLWSALNTFRVDQVGWLNNFAAIFQVVSVFILFSALLGLSPSYTSAQDVFTQYRNQSGFTDVSYVVAGGITSSLFSFAGYEASAHMAEETSHSQTSAPKGIIFTCICTGIGGLMILFALMSSYQPNLDDYYLAGTGNIVADIFIYVTGPTWGQALTWMVCINFFFSGLSSVSITGRITYALTRDNGFLFSDFLSQVNPTFKSPLRSIMFIFCFDAVFLLLPLDPGSALAYFAIVSLSTLGFQVSYGVPIFLKLIYPQPNFPRTAMSLGRWSDLFGVISCIWLFGSSCLLFLPVINPVTSETMNWLIVVVAGVFVIGAINWLVSGQYYFTGPKRSPYASVPYHESKVADVEGTVANQSD